MQQRRQQVLASSSTDNITLLSKIMRPLGKTQSSDIICSQIVPDRSSPGQDLPLSTQRATYSTLPSGSALPQPPLTSEVADQVINNITYNQSKPIRVNVNDMDINNDTSKVGKKAPSLGKTLYKSLVQTERFCHTASNRRPINVVHLHSKSLDDEPSLLSCENFSSSNTKHQNRNSSPTFEGADMLRPRDELGTQLTKPSASKSDRAAVKSTQSHSQNTMATGCRSSTDNSDSGRESMLDSADNGLHEPPTAMLSQ